MLKGLIIDADYDNGMNIKLIMEHANRRLKMDVLDQSRSDFFLIDTTDYDFMIASSSPVLAEPLLKKAIPFLHFVMDKSTDYMEIDRSKEILMIDRNHLIGVEVIEKNCFVHTFDEIIMVRRVSMGNLLETLNMPELVRCHKSYAVNVKYIKGFKRETRTRWKVKFFIDTNFDVKATNIYMDEVIKVCEAHHGISFSDTL